MTSIKPLIAGNWKMHGVKAALAEVEAVKSRVTADSLNEHADIMFCLPATLLAPAAQLLTGTSVLLGGQDCHHLVSGAHTGDISAEMLADAGAAAVIIGHSERRTDHAESSKDVALKAQAAHDCNLQAIVCIGETKGERSAGLTLNVVKRQLRASLPNTVTSKNIVIAYEPVWAIGTGLTPSLNDVSEVHRVLRAELEDIVGSIEAQSIKLIYGGSVKPGNAKDILSLANVNGALVGGASLKSEDFLGIISSCKI